MKNISIKELNSIMCNGSIFAGVTVTHGKNVYRINKLDNGVKWVCYMPCEKYRSNSDKYDNTSEGWFALLRIA